MNTLLKFLAVMFAASLPLIVAAGFLGISLPSFINASYAFTGFAVSVGLMTLFADYRPMKSLTESALCRQSRGSRAALPLAA
jgi:ABC-type Co2+ transport system permease subunit